MSNNQPTLRIRPFLGAHLLLVLLLSACLEPDSPLILQAQETPVIEEEAEVIGGPVEAVEEGIDVVVEEAKVEELTSDEQNDLAAATALENVLVHASFLVQRDVTNQAGDVIGSVEDLVFDIENGQILYVILDRDQFLGLGSQDFPMPLAAFLWNSDFEMVLALDENVLESIPQVDDEWPLNAGDQWNDGITDFWAGHDLAPATDPEAAPVRSGKLFGLHAGGLGEELGTVEDFLVDLGQARVAYVGIFTTEGFYDPDLVLIVPFAAANLTFEVLDGSPVYALTLLAVDAAVLEAAPAIERSAFQTVDFIDEALSEELALFWEEQGFTGNGSE